MELLMFHIVAAPPARDKRKEMLPPSVRCLKWIYFYASKTSQTWTWTTNQKETIYSKYSFRKYSSQYITDQMNTFLWLLKGFHEAEMRTLGHRSEQKAQLNHAFRLKPNFSFKIPNRTASSWLLGFSRKSPTFSH